MPIYEYKCPACGCEFEVKQNYNDKALVRCPKCRTVAKRQISNFNFTFAQPKRESKAMPGAGQVRG